MSYWIYLENVEGHPVEVENHSEGGTYAMGGIGQAELNVTYNYGSFFHEYLNPEGLPWLNEKKASEVLPALVNAVDQLGTDPDGDYWKATPGNAGKALSILAGWAKENPDAVFRVS